MSLGPPSDEAFEAALRREDPETVYQHAPCGYLSLEPGQLCPHAEAKALLGQHSVDSETNRPGGES